MPYRRFPDTRLVELTGAGDDAAYAMLWRRHRQAAHAAARAVAASSDAEDAVSEAFLRVLRAIRGGGGPRSAFRAYLIKTTRNVAVSWQRMERPQTHEDLDAFGDPSGSEADTERSLDEAMASSALHGLPERWRKVLWYVDVEGIPTREVAALMGIQANAVAALTYRARERLRQEWIRAHVDPTDEDVEHQWVIQALPEFARHRLEPPHAARVLTHLGSCSSCSLVQRDLRRLGPRLREAIVPVLIGIAAAGLGRLIHTTDHLADAAAVTGALSSAVFRLPKPILGQEARRG